MTFGLKILVKHKIKNEWKFLQVGQAEPVLSIPRPTLTEL